MVNAWLGYCCPVQLIEALSVIVNTNVDVEPLCEDVYVQPVEFEGDLIL